MSAERSQEAGRAGAMKVKRLLEATTHIDLPFSAYDQHAGFCLLKHVSGNKMFDLAGNYHAGSKDPVFVESKNYSSAGRQASEFQEFLAIAYGATLQEAADKGEHARPLWFMWVTYHPFSSTKWKKLETGEYMVESIKAQSKDFLKGAVVNPVLAQEISARVSVMVANHRHDELSLTAEELSRIRPELDKLRGA